MNVSDVASEVDFLFSTCSLTNASKAKLCSFMLNICRNIIGDVHNLKYQFLSMHRVLSRGATTSEQTLMLDILTRVARFQKARNGQQSEWRLEWKPTCKQSVLRLNQLSQVLEERCRMTASASVSASARVKDTEWQWMAWNAEWRELIASHPILAQTNTSTVTATAMHFLCADSETETEAVHDVRHCNAAQRSIFVLALHQMWNVWKEKMAIQGQGMHVNNNINRNTRTGETTQESNNNITARVEVRLLTQEIKRVFCELFDNNLFILFRKCPHFAGKDQDEGRQISDDALLRQKGRRGIARE